MFKCAKWSFFWQKLQWSECEVNSFLFVCSLGVASEVALISSGLFLLLPPDVANEQDAWRVPGGLGHGRNGDGATGNYTVGVVRLFVLGDGPVEEPELPQHSPRHVVLGFLDFLQVLVVLVDDDGQVVPVLPGSNPEQEGGLLVVDALAVELPSLLVELVQLTARHGFKLQHRLNIN